MTGMGRWLGIGAFVFGFANAPVLSAQCLRTEHQQLGLEAPMSNDYAGIAVDLDAGVLVWGAPGASGGWISSYVLHGDEWQLQDRVRVVSDLEPTYRLGDSIALDGDRMVAGDPIGNSSLGAVYTFEWQGSEWVNTQKLVGFDSDENDQFGWGVDIDGDWLFASTHEADDVGHYNGAVYAFEHDGTQWVSRGRLRSSGEAPFEYYGRSISLDGTRLVVGAPNSRTDDGRVGKVYVFEFDGESWVEVQVLEGMDREQDYAFGGVVDLDGDVLAVATNGDTSTTGAVELFEHDGQRFVGVQRLVPDENDKLVTAGRGLSLHGGALAIGSPQHGGYEGVVYVFRRAGDQWVLVEELAVESPRGGPQLGHDVVLRGAHLVAGAPLADEVDVNSGAVYTYILDPLGFGVSSTQPESGSEVTLESCGGLASGLQFFAILSVDGLAHFKKLNFDRFDAHGHVSKVCVVPPGLQGLRIRLQSFGETQPGEVGTSQTIEIVIQE